MTEAGLTYASRTAWRPPLDAVVAMASQFSDLTFGLDYCEPTRAFAGHFDAHGKRADNKWWEDHSRGDARMVAIVVAHPAPEGWPPETCELELPSDEEVFGDL